MRSCVNEAACDGIDACASADNNNDNETSTPSTDAGSNTSTEQCSPNVKGCATRSGDPVCAPYAKAGYSLPLACCGGTDPTQGNGGLDCEGPIVQSGTDRKFWCCKT